MFAARLAKVAGRVDLDDQVEACRRVFASDTRWTVVRGSSLEEGDSQGLPVWGRHAGDPILKSDLTRRVDFALFMVDALTNDELVHEAPAIVGCRTPSALAHAAATGHRDSTPGDGSGIMTPAGTGPCSAPARGTRRLTDRLPLLGDLRWSPAVSAAALGRGPGERRCAVGLGGEWAQESQL